MIIKNYNYKASKKINNNNNNNNNNSIYILFRLKVNVIIVAFQPSSLTLIPFTMFTMFTMFHNLYYNAPDGQ